MAATTAQSAGGKRSLRFVHLSDPHMTSLETVAWRSLISKRLLGYLSWRHKRRAEHRVEVLEALNKDLGQRDYDHLVITGDLTHISLPEEFVQARNWLNSLGNPEDISIVPGNHDAYVNLPVTQGLSQWAPFYASDPGTPASAGFPSLRVRGEIAFIGLSSAVATRPLLATGRVGQAQRQRFAELLQWAGERGLCRVVLIHHPPVVGLEKWRKRLVDAKQVGRIIDDCGAELVLHGHCHRPLENRLSYAGRSQVPVIGAPSALSIHPDVDRVARYYLFQIESGPEHWRIKLAVYRYVHAENRFCLHQERQLAVPRRAAVA